MASRYEAIFYTLTRPDRLQIPVLNLELNPNQAFSLGVLEGMGFALELHKKKKATFHIQAEQLFIEIEGQRLNIEHEIDLFILNEIYILNEYQLSYPNNFGLIDIGMNVGLVSLYFAQQPNCQQVYGFEPIAKTYKKALANFALNPILQSKITASNIGLGKEEESLDFFYDADKHGNTSGIVARNKTQEEQSVKAEIRRASSLINHILETTTLSDFIIKMDCEGMEFDIFESFEGTIPSKIKGFMLEWHFKYPSNILETLDKNGFISINNTRAENLGMIYAFRA